MKQGKVNFHTGPLHSDETKEIIRQSAIRRKLGGVRQSRRVTYNGKVLGSSYEVKVAESLDRHGIKWDTCKFFHYNDPTGKRRRYTPDLYLSDYDIYLDPKNDFLINNINPSMGFKDTDKIKLVEEQNGIIVFVLNKNELDWTSIKNKIADVADTGLARDL